MSSHGESNSIVSFLQEFSIPLIAGVVLAVVFANVNEHSYHEIVEWGPLDGMCSEEGGSCVELHGHGHGDDHAGDGHAEDDHGDDGHAEDDHGDEAHADDGHAEDAHDEEAHADEEANPAAHVDDLREDDDHGEVYGFGLFGHHLTLHFLINDIFMLLFFGVAAKEITESLLPGGALNPPSKAVNPLLGTLGGVVGPVGVFLVLAAIFVNGGQIDVTNPSEAFSAIGKAFAPGAQYPADTAEAIYRGWGVPTATDIALAWLVARLIFGGSHPAVNFLLLLAIADDAIGLIIIAVFYPNPAHPVAPAFLLLVLLGMGVAYVLRVKKVQSWVPYILVGGTLSWLGLLNASLHPALALVPIVPFLPGPSRDTGLYNPQDDQGEMEEVFSSEPTNHGHDHSPLQNFEHAVKATVDFGLFFFGFANAGVAFSSVGYVTVVVLAALIIGKIVGITLFSWAGNAAGFKYPEGMNLGHILTASAVAGVGLTVALFVAGEAYADANLQAMAKMGALASVLAAPLAFALGRVFNVRELVGVGGDDGGGEEDGL